MKIQSKNYLFSVSRISGQDWFMKIKNSFYHHRPNDLPAIISPIYNIQEWFIYGKRERPTNLAQIINSYDGKLMWYKNGIYDKTESI